VRVRKGRKEGEGCWEDGGQRKWGRGIQLKKRRSQKGGNGLGRWRVKRKDWERSRITKEEKAGVIKIGRGRQVGSGKEQ